LEAAVPAEEPVKKMRGRRPLNDKPDNAKPGHQSW
jgi:hypothetical protein